MSGIRCFLLEETPTIRRYLRRYCSASKCEVSRMGCHDAIVFLDEVEASTAKECCAATDVTAQGEHAGWPGACACGYAFADSDRWQVSTERLMRRADTGERMPWRDAPPGAMRYCDWFVDPHRPRNAHWHAGPDGHVLVVKCPPDGWEWIVDGRCSNCTLPDDTEHSCWVRHGVAPDITVDKNGRTCNAGAGSILTKTWHGFLRGGYLVEC